jgi:dienelactone hydrolase
VVRRLRRRFRRLRRADAGPAGAGDGRRLKAAIVAISLATLACGGGPAPTASTPPAPFRSPAVATDASCAAFTVTGDPASSGGTRWTYASTDAGQRFVLEGVLFVPGGAGPFPGVVVSHGGGGSPSSYSSAIARTMVGWGLAVIATRYTHANDADGRNATFLPAGGDGASEANVARARKARSLLGCVAGVDLARIAAHGHSMGAFLTAELVGTYPADFRAASHTAGGTSPGPLATRPATAAAIRTPYQIHHGDQDRVVLIAQDEALAAILAANAVAHEFHRYLGLGHEQVTSDPVMLDRVRDWYTRHGVLR